MSQRFTARIENTYTRRLHAPGTAGLPSLSFVDDVEAGLFMDGATLSAASGGRAVLRIDGAGVEFLGPLVVDGQLVSGNAAVTVDPADLSNVASDVVAARDDTFTFGAVDRRWHQINVANVYATNVTTDTIAISDELLDRVANALLAENLVVDLEHIESDIAPADTDRYDVGSSVSAWSEAFLSRAIQGEVAVDVNGAVWSPGGLDANTITVSGNLLAADDGGIDRFIDLEHIDSNVSPDADGTRAIGATDARWAVVATDVVEAPGSLDVGPLGLRPGLATLSGTIVTDGDVVDHNGVSLFDSFDPGNVETTIAASAIANVGAPDGQWRTIYSNAIDLGNTTVSFDANGLVVDSNIYALTAVVDGCAVATPNVSAELVSVTVTDDAWAPSADPITSLAGGFVVLAGEGLGPELAVFVGDTLLKETTYVSDTECRLVVPPVPSGTYDLTIHRVDTIMDTITDAITVVPGIVLKTPDVVLESEATITLGVPFSYTIDAGLDGVGRESSSLTFDLVDAPAGFSLSSDGVIEGRTYDDIEQQAAFSFTITSDQGAKLTSETSFTFKPNGFDLDWIRSHKSRSYTIDADESIRCFILPLLDGRWVAWGRFDKCEYGTLKSSLIDPAASDSDNLKRHGGKIVDIGTIGSVKVSIDAGAVIVDAVSADGWQSKQATARVLTSDGHLHVGGFNYRSSSYGGLGSLGIDSDNERYPFFRSNQGSLTDKVITSIGNIGWLTGSIVVDEDGRLHALQLPDSQGGAQYQIGLPLQSESEEHWLWRELVLPGNDPGTPGFSKPRLISSGRTYFILLEDGRLYSAGQNSYGTAARYHEKYSGPWRDLAQFNLLGALAGKTNDITDIRTCHHHTIFFTSQNELFICGALYGGAPDGADMSDGSPRVDASDAWGMSFDDMMATDAYKITQIALPLEPHQIDHIRVLSRSIILFSEASGNYVTGLKQWRNMETESVVDWRPLKLGDDPALEGETIVDVIGCESVQMIICKSGRTFFRTDKAANSTGCFPYPISDQLVDGNVKALDAIELTKQQLLENIYEDP